MDSLVGRCRQLDRWLDLYINTDIDMHIKNNLEMNKFNFHIDPYFYIKTCTAKEEKQIQLRSAPLIITKESETG